MARIIIPYRPRGWAKIFHASDKRYKILVLHRRAGKTVAALNHLQRDALRYPKTLYAYIGPTYRQTKNIVWSLFKEYAQPIPKKVNESELYIEYANGSRITLYGSDNPDSLRGIGLDGVVFDEYSQQPSNIYGEIIRPALSDRQGYAVWIGTPKGKNNFYELYQGAQNNDKWFSMLLPASQSGILPQSELDDARSQMTDDEYEQEYECSFVAAIRGAYYSKELAEARAAGRITKVPYEKGLSVHTWWDLGVADATAIGFYQNVGREWRWIDCYSTSGEGMQHYARILQEKPYVYGYHYAPHDIEVRELGSGMSRMQTAKNLGINFRIAPNLPIQEGIHALRMRFGELWIDEEKCKPALEALSLYRKEWDDKRGEFKMHPYHDWTSHYADQSRYWAVTNIQPQISQYRPNFR